ncbi:YggS family pyridoxal phosphate-dependent enzyme [Sediminibacillus massiliensis]|uniref:YggS family pyridoxal phosphate-dependent enzyme n=1 Tax=Sediminibacillus massiliensis TaxID=1926277 RepID=UPI0009883205|nr:YggS family pyridoxal phosphate-dependent enzyme [Sediminibacillus massiliensis]
MEVKENLQEIRQNIRQACGKVNRNPEEITIIAVTKYVTIERTQAALEAGIMNLGENRLEGFSDKYEAIGDKAVWHFIGSLQSRKVKDMINEIDVLHSLDRKSLAKEINKRANSVKSCFIQVNVSGEESKHGISPDEVVAFVESLQAYEKIRVDGLMTMAPNIEDEDKIRSVFRELRHLRELIISKNLSYAPCQGLSMGMSNDYHIAIEEGATHIRIGSKLVGQ